MGTLTVYPNDYCGWSEANAAYQTARLGPGDDAYVGYVGQYYNGSNSFSCWQYSLRFATSAATGSIETATLSVYRDGDGSEDNDQPFAFEIREKAASGWRAWVAGGLLGALPLLGSTSSADMTATAYTDITLAGLVGTELGDAYYCQMCSDKQRVGAAPGGAGRVQVSVGGGVASDDVKLTIVYGNRPEIPTIKSPSATGQSGTINLTAAADDPNGGNIHMHWEYSTNGGSSWTECANSPSAAAAEGSDITITWAVVGSVGDIIQLRCKADDGTNQSIDYATVTIANGAQTNMALWRDAGTHAVGDAISGVVITRPVSAPSSLSFRVDNFDAGEADIADDDELILTLNTETPGTTYSWRGFVREKRVGDIMEVYAEDISYRFASRIVTRTLADTQTVGTVVRAIVEDPSGAEPTGIVCSVAEVDDPLSPGSYISVTAFDGQGRPVLDWLDDLAEMTGAAWRVWHDGTNWRFDWWVPADNSAWAVACKDNIEYSAESSSQARVLNAPMVSRDRRQYCNRVWWWYDNSGTWTLDSVETAAVTAGTEEPIEVVLSTKSLDATAAESLANAYLAAYNATRVSIEDVQIFGIRDLDLDNDVTLTLARRGITATAYPITQIEYRVLDQGHVTSITLGDPALDGIRALQRLQRRLQDVTAEVRN